MAKTYILEPMEITTVHAGDGSATSISATDELSAALQLIDSSSIAEVAGAVLQYAGTMGSGIFFTPDGSMPSEEVVPEHFLGIMPQDNFFNFSIAEPAGTYTLSIYKETDDEDSDEEGGIPGLDDKNVVYEYQLAANNNIKDILMAVMEQNGDNAVNIPGYSVMQLLVENLLVFHSITGEKLTTFRATTFANDVAKIAWIIRNA